MTIEDIFEYNKPYNERIIKSLIEKIKNKNIVPYIGAGMSMIFDEVYPSWNGFLEDSFNEFFPDGDKSEFDKGSYEDKADFLQKEIGHISFFEHLQDTFGSHHLDGKDINDFSDKAVFFLPEIFDTGLLITTNYDKVLEKVYGLKGKILSIKESHKQESLNNAIRNDGSDEVLLYKIHGDVSMPRTSIVLTKEQYDDAYKGKLTEVLKKIYASKVILFLSCSLDGDRPIEIMKEVMEEGMSNYAIISCEKDNKTERRKQLEQVYSTQSIIYPEGQHECLKIILEYIAEKINTDKTETKIINSRQLINNIPQAKSTFLGREKEIKEISEQLTKRNVLFLCGVGGIGKSELVKEYITSNKANYKNINFTTYDGSIKSTLLNGVKFLNNEFNSNNIDENYEKWKNLISSLNLKETLIVIDNVDDMENDTDFNEAIKFLSSKGIYLIITTRIKGYSGYNKIEVKPIGQEQLLNFFINTANIESEELSTENISYIINIIELFEGHTMAVELAALQYANSYKNISEYYKSLNEGIVNAETKVMYCKDDVNQEYETAHYFLDALFDLSKLTEEDIELLKILALVPVTGIDIVDFLDALKLNKDNINLVNKLSHLGWVQKEEKRVHLHALISDIVLTRYKPSITEENLNSYIQFILDGLENNKANYNDVSKFLEYLSAFANKISRIKHTENSNIYLDVTSILLEYCFYDLALKISQEGLEKYIEKFGTIDSYVAKSYNYLGIIYQSKGELDEALENYSKSLQVGKCLYAENHPDMARNYNNIGGIYQSKGEIHKAIHFFGKSLEIEKKLCGNDDSCLVAIYNNIGHMFQSEGKLDEALDNYNKSLQIEESLNVVNHSYIAGNYNNIGGIYQLKGDLDKALEYYEKSIHINNKFYGESNRLMAITYINVGDLYRTKYKLDRSENYYIKALKILKDIYGENHPHVGVCYTNIASVYYLTKQFNESLKHYEKSRAIYQALKGDYSKRIEEINDNIKRLKIEIGGSKQNVKVKKIGRNEKCFCGSGKKYKRCCGKK